MRCFFITNPHSAMCRSWILLPLVHTIKSGLLSVSSSGSSHLGHEPLSRFSHSIVIYVLKTFLLQTSNLINVSCTFRISTLYAHSHPLWLHIFFHTRICRYFYLIHGTLFSYDYLFTILLNFFFALNFATRSAGIVLDFSVCGLIPSRLARSV